MKSATPAVGFGQTIESFQAQQPGGLLGAVEFGGPANFFPENIVDVLARS